MTIYFRNQLTLCDLLMKVDLQDYSEHSVDKLSIEEKENIRIYISDKILDLGYILSKYNEYDIKEHFFIYPTKSVFSHLNSTFLYEDEINNISLYINKTLDKYYQDINSFFERALLELEMETF